MRALALIALAFSTHAVAQLKVQIVSPSAGTQYLAPASISITAQANVPAARVEFLANGELIGAATAAPYTVIWSGAPMGTHQLRVRLVENDGQASLSPMVPVQVTDRTSGQVNASPAIQITSPAPGTVLTAPASVTLTASATDSDGAVTRVDFFQGTTQIGSSTAAPYSVTLANLQGGTYTFSASATDDLSAVTASAPTTVIVNVRPTVSVTFPAANQVFHAPAEVAITADASDSDGIIQKVDFYDGTTLVGTATSSPFSVTLSDAVPGSHALTAVATDNHGATATSTPVAVTVNARPTVALTSPTINSTFNAPANIPLSADALDGDGTIASVDFFFGETLIATRTAPPYGFTWTGVPAGTYLLTARVTDNLGASVSSAGVSITVNNSSIAKIYYIHVDHLNTPRLVVNDQQRAVWRWDHQEPFGASVPDENPSALGAFEFPLRFPGQYFDKETGLAHNWHRDYWAEGGRYIQFDPIGLRAGINGYLYVGANPLSWTDPTGLKAFQCRKPLDAFGGSGTHSGPDIRGNPAFHQYSCVIDANGQVTCGGQDRTGSALSSPGTPSKDSYDSQRCTPTYDNKCFDDCLKREWQKPRPRYGIPFGTDCQEYDDDVNSKCRKECGLQ